MQATKHAHAIIIGGGIAGMCGARVLADHFERVTLLEQDHAQPHEGPRKGIPQGSHCHGLLQGGSRALDRLFPGILDELVRAGSKSIDFSADVSWFHHGQWKKRHRGGVDVLVQTRPLLDSQVRRRLADYPNIEIQHGTKVTGLIGNADRTRVIGLACRQAGRELDMFADLIVDASGRASRTPIRLEKLGYKAPGETSIGIDLAYSTALYRPTSSAQVDWTCLIVYPCMPETARIGYVFAVERDTWMVTLGGYLGEEPPVDHDGFLAFAKTLPVPELWQALQHAEPVSPVKVHRSPRAVWRHYERMKQFPDGLIVMGDAVCALDPVFGQGMSVAILEALELGECLKTRDAMTTGFSRHVHARQARLIEVPWFLATTEIMRYPQVPGKRSLKLRLLQWYADKLFKHSASDAEVYGAFLEVVHLLAGPSALFRPGMLRRVLARRPRRDEARGMSQPCSVCST